MSGYEKIIMNKKITEKIIWTIIIVLIAVAVFALSKWDIHRKESPGLSSEFIYNIDENTSIDPQLITYREITEKTVHTGLKNPKEISVAPDGLIFVAGDSQVKIFDKEGNLKKQIQLPYPATSIYAGKITYVATENTVEIINHPNNDTTTWLTLDESSVITSIDVYKSNVFLADAGKRVVLRLDKDAQIINKIGLPDPQRNIRGFVIPGPNFDLKVSPDGLLRVVNPGRHLIEAYTFDGDLEIAWGHYSPEPDGFCGCCNPVNFTIMKNGNFITVEKGIVRIKEYDPDGVFKTVVADPKTLLSNKVSLIQEFPSRNTSWAFDVAVDEQNNVIVLDTLNAEIRFFEKK